MSSAPAGFAPPPPPGPPLPSLMPPTPPSLPSMGHGQPVHSPMARHGGDARGNLLDAIRNKENIKTLKHVSLVRSGIISKRI